MDTSSPTGGRHAPNIFFRDGVSISDSSVSQGWKSVNRLKTPALTDERSRAYEERQAVEYRGEKPQNAVYFLEPEEIAAIKRVDAPSPTGALLERNIVFRDGTSTIETNVPQSGTSVNTHDA